MGWDYRVFLVCNGCNPIPFKDATKDQINPDGMIVLGVGYHCDLKWHSRDDKNTTVQAFIDKHGNYDDPDNECGCHWAAEDLEYQTESGQRQAFRLEYDWDCKTLKAEREE